MKSTCLHFTDKYSVRDMSFRWKKDNPITFPKDFDEGFFRLPKYVVSFSTEKEPHIVNYGDVEHCSARLEIILSREVKSYLLENYLPSTLFVSMSWGSFVVVPEIVPGRMVSVLWMPNPLAAHWIRIDIFVGASGDNASVVGHDVWHGAQQLTRCTRTKMPRGNANRCQLKI